MARAGDKVYAQSVDVVIGVVEAVYFQFATVARSRIDVADSQRAPDMMQDLRVDFLYLLRSASSGCGGFSVFMPVRKICLMIGYMANSQSCQNGENSPFAKGGKGDL